MSFKMKFATATGAVLVAAAGAAQAANPAGACGAEYGKVYGKAYAALGKTFAKFCKAGATAEAAAELGPKLEDKVGKIFASYNDKIVKLLPECDADFAELFPTTLPSPVPGSGATFLTGSDYKEACDGTDNPAIP